MEGGGREETGAAKRDGERKRWKQRERRGRGRRRGRRRARAPHHGGKHSATVIARPRPYLLFTWLPALCTRTTIPFQRLEPLETLARTRIAPYVVDLLAAAFYFSLSSMRRLVSILLPCPFSRVSLSLSLFGNGRGGREPSLGTNKA